MVRTKEHVKVGQGSFYRWELNRWDDETEESTTLASGEVPANGIQIPEAYLARRAIKTAHFDHPEATQAVIRRGNYQSVDIGDVTTAEWVHDESWICNGFYGGVSGWAWETETF
jgi:hypothetical protein